MGRATILLAGGALALAAGLARADAVDGGPADPDSPRAVLRFDSALARYRPLDERPLAWRGLFDERGNFSAGAPLAVRKPATHAHEHPPHHAPVRVDRQPPAPRPAAAK